MPLHAGLLEQARLLATRDVRGRPRQDNLRRAVSSAYYALFHFLIDEATRFLVGTRRERWALRAVLARGFDHGTMRSTSTAFAGGTLPARFAPALGAVPVPPVLRDIAAVFRTLQEQHHIADYDRLRRSERQEVLLLIRRADTATRSWPAVRGTPAGRLYFVALLAGDRIRE